MRIERLDAPRCRGGENPLWDDQRQLLYYIDNSGRKVHCLDPATGDTRTLPMPDVITAMVLRQAGGAVVTLHGGIHFLDLDSGELTLVAQPIDPARNVYNDGKVDSRGRFLIGVSTKIDRPAPDGGLIRLDPDLGIHWLDDDIYFSNGPCWSLDERTFYFADSWRRTIYAYDYDPAAGAVSRRRPFVHTDALGGLPDGATVDADDRLWTAIYQGGKIATFGADGVMTRCIDLPVRYPSSLTFGGAGMDRLFVTTIDHGTGDESGDGAGCLHVIDGIDTRGRPAHRFGG